MPSSFCFANRSRPMKITFVEFANPAEVGFEQGGRLVDLVTIQAHSRFQPQGVARGQTTGQHAIFLAVLSGFKNLVPELLGFVRGRVNFKPVFAGVARARDNRPDTVNFAFGKVVVLNLSERNWW